MYNKMNEDGVRLMCKQNYDFFVSNFESLYKNYANKYLAIKDCKVIGVYDDFDSAVFTTLKTEEVGSFVVQHCVEEKDEANTFHSNNIVFSVV